MRFFIFPLELVAVLFIFHWINDFNEFKNLLRLSLSVLVCFIWSVLLFYFGDQFLIPDTFAIILILWFLLGKSFLVGFSIYLLFTNISAIFYRFFRPLFSNSLVQGDICDLLVLVLVMLLFWLLRHKIRELEIHRITHKELLFADAVLLFDMLLILVLPFVNSCGLVSINQCHISN